MPEDHQSWETCKNSLYSQKDENGKYPHTERHYCCTFDKMLDIYPTKVISGNGLSINVAVIKAQYIGDVNDRVLASMERDTERTLLACRHCKYYERK